MTSKARALREGSWLLALLIAVGVALSRNPMNDFPLGSDWEQYLTGAVYFWVPRDEFGSFPDWRKPLYPFLVGVLGQKLTYTTAALYIARASIIGVFTGTALTARALSGPLAAVASLFVLLLIPQVPAAMHWANVYPMLAGLSALSIGLGACAARWPHPALALLTGIAAGLTLATDARGLALMPMAAGLVVLGLPRARLLPAALSVALFAGGAAAGPGWDRWLISTYQLNQLPLDKQIVFQRSLILDEIRMAAPDPALREACLGVKAEPISPEGLQTPCASALLAYNQSFLDKRAYIPPPGMLFWLPLALLPMAWNPRRERWRGWLASSVAAAGIFGAPLISTAAGMSWVVYTDRYALQFAAVMACIVAVPADRAARLLTRLLRRVKPLERLPMWPALLAAALIAVASAHSGWPGRTGRLSTSIYNSSELRWEGNMVSWIASNVVSGDYVIDCGNVNAGLALAPAFEAEYAVRRAELSDCVNAIDTAPTMAIDGELYLITYRQRYPNSRVPERKALLAMGWQEIKVPGHSDRHLFHYVRE